MGYNTDEDLDEVDRSAYLIGILFVAIVSGLTGCALGMTVAHLLF